MICQSQDTPFGTATNRSAHMAESRSPGTTGKYKIINSRQSVIGFINSQFYFFHILGLDDTYGMQVSLLLIRCQIRPHTKKLVLHHTQKLGITLFSQISNEHPQMSIELIYRAISLEPCIRFQHPRTPNQSGTPFVTRLRIY
ncbi:hypothetical protein SDC9_183754 [bioreactor metagenome]|uniref:Uncharacterized protein n=1 Tax=bioreactor metagenome TaxID=1076179 RepID=A0A645HB38_9ZZZZ